MTIDTVVTHTCPMDKIYNQLIADNHPLKNWYYVHFHQSPTELIDNISYSLLNIMEIKEA